MSKFKPLFWARCWVLLAMLLSLPGSVLFAQTRTVNGTVSNAKAEPLAGASVSVSGASTTVQTGSDGRFTISLPAEKSSITVSMIGYTPQTIAVTEGQTVQVVLAEAQSNMEEVVVVGYGRQRRGTLTGSVAQISGAELKKAPAINLSNVLAGRLPGLTVMQQSGRPGFDDATLRIRGINTTGASAPMIIVDGVQRSFSQLDPNEIENITILKDAAAAAVYGLQAAGGVILVTTKRGLNRKAVITYDGSVSLNSLTRFPEFLNGPDYMYWYKKGEELDNEYLMHINSNPIPYTYTDEEIDAMQKGTNSNPFYGNTDWIGELLGKRSLTQHHNVSVRGGNESVKYFTSIGMLDQEGVVRNNDFKRFNLRSNLDFTLSSIFSGAIDLGARKEDRMSSGIPADNGSYMNPFFQAVRALPNIPMYTPEGIPTASRAGAGVVNPIAALDNSGYQKYETTVLQSNLSLSAKIPFIKGLTAKVLFGYDRTNQQFKSWLQPYEMMVRERSSSGWYWNKSLPPGITVNTLRQSSAISTRETYQPQLNYENRFGNHDVKALFVYEYSQTDGNSFSTGARNFALTDLHEINYGSKDVVDYITPTGSSDRTARAGYVGRLNYAYKSKYLAELVARYDASYNFAPENRWGLFPAASLGWVISQEDFFDNLSSTINMLKVRGSAGLLGNDRIGEFQYLQTFSLTTSPVVVIGGRPVTALFTTAVPNRDITWEKTTTYNVGFEATLWRGKLDVEFDWFYKITRDILDNVAGIYPPSVGGNFPSVVNRSIVDNRGFDLRLSHRNTIGRKLRYGVTGNFNYAKNRLIRRDVASGTPEWMNPLGRPLGQKVGYISEGLFQNWTEVDSWPSSPSGGAAPGFIKYRDLNGDGQITQGGDFTFIGRSNFPEIMYGLNLDLQYGAFDLSALFQGAARADVSLGGTYEGSAGVSGVMDNTPFTRSFYNLGNSPYYLIEQAWRPDNPNATLPRLTANRAGYANHNGWMNSQYVVNGAYLRLKSIQLGYNVPKNLLNRIKVDNIRFYVAGFNLFTWDHLKYLDPEMPNANNGFYPQQKMMTFGANLTF
ncbi:MAG TPA: TonB-dependent receptor [Flavisolibacter sp.]|nr:TonB-dependent receptor [Flavisolibacter sp.]